MKKLCKFLLIVFFFINPVPVKSQSNISGVINKYAKVISYNNVLKDRVTVDAPTNFLAGDTALLIQMRGASIDTINNIIDAINGAGKYEFIQIASVTNASGLVVFNNKVLNNYNSGEAIQLVRVPSYNSAKVTGPLTCDSWDGNKGGILAFFVNDTLELNNDIDVSAKGFLGASPVQYTGACAPGVRYYYTAVAGKKGESIIGNYFDKPYGKGFIINGGGGGNGLYAGGGGGGGVSQGSRGNRMALSCTDPGNLGGGGYGLGISDYFIGTDDEHKDRVFFGGGGGSGTYPAGATSANGGNGGGIIFIMAKYIKNKNDQYILKANGQEVTTIATNNAGTGGGGGGGTILLSAEKFVGKMKAEVKGGNGGSVDNYCSGQGGGGGGGFIWYTTPVAGSIDSAFVADGGQKGDYKNSFGCNVLSTQANDGYSLRSFNPVLNGFLYNLIGEEHTICYGKSTNVIKGTFPRGGNGVYTFQWQKRKYNVSTWTDIPSSNIQNYSATFLNDTSYFRRIVKTSRKNSSGIEVLMVDTSKAIRVNVIPQIKNNTITPSYIELCSGQPPVILVGGVATRQGDPAPTYFWKTHKRGSAWTDGIIPNTSKDYGQTTNSTTLTTSDTTYYHRIVSSLFCKDTVTSTIVVHPKITDDSTWVNLGEWRRQETCYGAIPKQILGSVPKGGKAGNYAYRWERSLDSAIWTLQLDSAKTNQNFSPGPLTETTFYRRIYYSGLQSVCKDTTKAFKVKVWPQIANNTISISQPLICEGTAPAPFTLNVGSITGGDGIYRHYWKRSVNGGSTWDSIPRAFLSTQYPNDALNVATSYKRVVGSGLYDCCRSESNIVSIAVQPRFRDHFISKDTTLCYKQQPSLLTSRKSPILNGGKKPYKYQWQQRIDNSKVWVNSGTDSIIQPGILNDTSYFRRIVISSDDICRDTASAVVKVLPVLKNNIITGDAELCNDSTMSKILGGSNLSGGAGSYRYKWDYKPAGGSWTLTSVTDADYPQSKLASVDTARITTFRRTVMSGLHDCCIDSSSKWDIKVFPRPISGGNLRDTSLVFDFAFKLVAPAPKMGSGVWRAIGFDPLFSPASDSTKLKVNIKFSNPEQTYRVQWIITTSKVCPSKIDSFRITIEDIDRYNGFSPNGDNINDYFEVKGIQNLLDANDFWEIKILNRWGGLVYSADINSDRLRSINELGKPKPLWDGKNQNGDDLSSDTYYYILTVFKKGDKPREYKGFVVMKR